MCITEYNETETMQMFREEGREEGLKQGANQLGKLIELLISSGRIDDAQKAATDEQARDTLYKEFNIF